MYKMSHDRLGWDGTEHDRDKITRIHIRLDGWELEPGAYLEWSMDFLDDGLGLGCINE